MTDLADGVVYSRSGLTYQARTAREGRPGHARPVAGLLYGDVALRGGADGALRHAPRGLRRAGARGRGQRADGVHVGGLGQPSCSGASSSGWAPGRWRSRWSPSSPGGGSCAAEGWFCVLTAAQAAGGLVFLPLMASLAGSVGWRAASLLIAAGALLVVPLVLLFLRNRPSDVGTLAYGAEPGDVQPEEVVVGGAVRRTLTVLRDASRTGTFWLLGGGVRDLWGDDRRPAQHPLRARRARPRHARHHRGRPARRRRRVRRPGHDRVGLVHRPRRPAQAARRLLRAARRVPGVPAVPARAVRGPAALGVHHLLRARLGREVVILTVGVAWQADYRMPPMSPWPGPSGCRRR